MFLENHACLFKSQKTVFEKRYLWRHMNSYFYWNIFFNMMAKFAWEHETANCMSADKIEAKETKDNKLFDGM